MVEWFLSLSPVAQALARHLLHLVDDGPGGGAGILFRTIDRKVLDGMLGFAAA